jgi:hypothetical protein
MRTSMTRVWSVTLVLAVALVLAACVRGSVNGSGKVVSETRPVSGFTAVELDGAGKLQLSQGDEEGLTIVADDNLLPLIESDVQGATLRLGFKEGTSISRFSELTYQLTVKDLEAVTVDGMAVVEGEDLELERLRAEINGAGTWKLGGSTDELDVEINGMGSFDSPELASRVARVVISGSGNVVVQVSETLDAEIDGAGSIRYIGSPQVTQHIAGAGSVAPR